MDMRERLLMAILLMLTDRLVTSFHNSNMTKAAEAKMSILVGL
jgi:hypothetical protein